MLTFVPTTAIAQGPRDHQEDRLHASARALFVCDGMGGHPDGDVAAQRAMDVLADSTPESAEQLRNTIVEAGEAVLTLGSGSPGDPGTTVAAAALTDAGLLLGWCGDSPVYVVRSGQILFRSQDHASWFGGITRCLGAGMAPDPDLELLDVVAGDVAIVCSDGVPAALGDQTDQTIAEVRHADELMAACEAVGLQDNTAIVVGVIRQTAGD